MHRYRREHRESDFIETAVADWGDTVYRVALNQTGSPSDAEDVRQDVFERLLTSAPSFADSEHLKAWLLRVTVNRCRDIAKSHSRSHTDLLEDRDEIAWRKLAALAEEDGCDDDSLTDELTLAIQQLPVDQQAAVELFYRKDLPTDEIANILQCSPGAVRTRLYRARNTLRKALTASAAVAIVLLGAAFLLQSPRPAYESLFPDSPAPTTSDDAASSSAPSNFFVLTAWAQEGNNAAPHRVAPADLQGIDWLHPQYWVPNYDPDNPFEEGPVKPTGIAMTTFNFDALCTGRNLVSVAYETTCESAWFSVDGKLAKSIVVDYRDEDAVKASADTVLSVIEPESPQISALIEQWKTSPESYWNELLPTAIAEAGRTLAGTDLVLTATFEDGTVQTKIYRIGLVEDYDDRCRTFVQAMIDQREDNEGIIADHEAMPSLFTLELIDEP